MSYSIIFETKIVKLADGRLLHLDLSGCNNDNAGRNRGDFTGKIYTVEEFIKRAEGFKKDSKPSKETDYFDLKIGSRYCTMYDYGEHLLRMMKRAITWEELDCAGRYVVVKKIDGIEVYDDEKTITMSVEEFEDYVLKNRCRCIRYSIIRTDLDTEKEIIKSLDNNDTVTFFIGKKRRIKKR